MTARHDDRDPNEAASLLEAQTELQRLAEELERATQCIRLRAWPPADARPAA